MLNNHSTLGASSMYRWSRCPGSVKLSEGISTPSSPFALEGTLAHEIGEMEINLAINGNRREDIDEYQNFIKKNKNIPDDMLDATEIYSDYVIENFVNNDHEIYLEKKFDLSEIYPGCFGTADCVAYNPTTKTLYVVDYKHGSGIPVEVKGNQQLRYYGLGALLDLKKPCDEVKLIVIQPRCSHPDGPIREEELSSMDLLEFSSDLIEFAKATEDPNASLSAGDWCRFCPANVTCPEIASNALKSAQQEFNPVKVEDRILIEGRELNEILDWLPVFENWIKNVREFAYLEAQKGRSPKGYKLVEKRATRKWKDTDAAVSILKDLGFEDEDIYKKAIITVAQAEKLAGKDRFNEIIEKKSTGTTLVHASDKRKAIERGPITEFSKV